MQENSMAKRFIRILHDKDSEQSRFREMLRSFEYRGKMSRRKTENPEEKDGLQRWNKRQFEEYINF